jgi:hypothetical protein
MADMALTAAPVLVYARNEDTLAALQKTVSLRGLPGEKFVIQVPEIQGYRLSRTDGEMAGEFGDESRTVTFYYLPAEWAETERFDSQEVDVLIDSPIYNAFQGGVVAEALAGTHLKVVRRIATTTGEFWYELPDARWIRYANINLKLRNAVVEVPVAPEVPTSAANDSSQLVGLVDYVPGMSVAVYDRPFGHEVGKVDDGLYVEIDETIHHETGIDWYHLTYYGWLTGIYLKFPNH